MELPILPLDVFIIATHPTFILFSKKRLSKPNLTSSFKFPCVGNELSKGNESEPTNCLQLLIEMTRPVDNSRGKGNASKMKWLCLSYFSSLIAIRESCKRFVSELLLFTRFVTI